MERVAYCHICKEVSWLAGRRNKKRTPFCHWPATEAILLCGCGFGVPLRMAGTQSNQITAHDRMCPPLDAGRYTRATLMEFILQFRDDQRPKKINLSPAPQTSRRPAWGMVEMNGDAEVIALDGSSDSDGSPPPKRPRTDAGPCTSAGAHEDELRELIIVSDEDYEVSD